MGDQLDVVIPKNPNQDPFPPTGWVAGTTKPAVSEVLVLGIEVSTGDVVFGDQNSSVTGVGLYDPLGAANTALLAAVSNTSFVDVCKAPYNLAPGNDATAAIQAIFNAAAAASGSAFAYASVPGEYTINGAQQTGTYVSSTCVTTLSGGQTLPESVITVVSTTGFDASGGQLSVGGQIVSYTNITGNTFVGCTGGTGTIANGATVALAYTYSGQILLPAVTPSFPGSQPTCVLGLCGPMPASLGNNYGQTATFVSNATSGNVIDIIPGGDINGDVESGITFFAENHTLVVPTNPQCGGYKLFAAVRAHTDGWVAKPVALASNPTALTGSGLALTMPWRSSNQQSIKDTWIQGFPTGIQPGDHFTAVGDCEIWACNTAIQLNGNDNPAVLNIYVGGCAQAINNIGLHKSFVEGHIGIECFASGWTAISINDPNDLIYGDLGIYWGSGVLPGIFGNQSNLNLKLDGAQESISSFAADNFTRSTSAPTTGAAIPGITDLTAHKYYVHSNTFLMSSGKLKAATAGALVQWPVPWGGASRRITAVLTTATTSYDLSIFGQIPWEGTTGNSIMLRVNGGTLTLRNFTGTVFATAAAGLIAGNTTYTISLDLFQRETGDANGTAIYRCRAWIGTTCVIDQTLASPVEATTSGAFAGDGLFLNELNSSFTSHITRAIVPDVTWGMTTSLAGTTAGTAVWSQELQGPTHKDFLVTLTGYENTTATAQTITFPVPFLTAPMIMHDDSGGASVSTTALTLPASMSSTKTGGIYLVGR